MKRAQQPERFYYDISIEHDPDHTDDRHYMKSKAEKTIYMELPLMEDPGDYNMSVCKFSINTEALPVMIPEINTYQLPPMLKLGFFDTNHEIKATINYVVTGSYKTIYQETTDTLRVPYNCHVNDIKKVDSSYWTKYNFGYIDNLDEQCYYYEYSSFINGLNYTFQKMTENLRDYAIEREKHLEHFCEEGNNKSFFYFELKENLLVLNVHKDLWHNNQYISLVNFHAKMPMYLYRLIGNGFNTKFNSDGTWEYNYDWKEIARIIENIAIKQEYSTLVNWNPLKAIVIGSDTIPAVGEFLPVAHYDGWLNHVKTKEYDDFLTETGQTRQDKDKDVFKNNTTCILDIYYPILTNPGDIRSTCVFSRDDISNGQVIELRHASPLTRFNIWIKWLDTYGNLHDLYLLPGCSCNIRFCFIKKSVMKEDLGEGISAVVGALAPPEEKKKKRGKSNGKPDGIVLDGADNYGWVHL